MLKKLQAPILTGKLWAPSLIYLHVFFEDFDHTFDHSYF